MIARLTCAAIVCLPLPAFAQDGAVSATDGTRQDSPAPVTAEQALRNADVLYKVGTAKRDPCPPQRAGEIVVCRRLEDPESQRVPGTIDQAIASGTSVADGVPRAPDLFGIADGGVSVAKGCFVPPCPPPPALMIDLKALPEPPAGSDAARYGYVPPPEAEATP